MTAGWQARKLNANWLGILALGVAPEHAPPALPLATLCPVNYPSESAPGRNDFFRSCWVAE